MRLRAAQAGVAAPGSVSAFLDAWLGLEWAHALLLTQQVGRAPQAWLREVAAAYLYQAVLRQLEDTGRLEYLRTWARVQQVGATPDTDKPDAFGSGLFEPEETRAFETGAFETGASEPKVGPNPPEAKAFSYPRSKMPLDDLLYVQSSLWLQAAELGEAHGWALTAAEVRSAAHREVQKGTLVKAALRAPPL